MPHTTAPQDSATRRCVVTTGHAALAPELREHLARTRVLRPGLLLHWENACERSDLVAQTEIDAGLRLVLLLEGSVEVCYGPRRVSLACGCGASSAAMVAVAEPEQLTRRAREGRYSRRVNLSLTPAWLAQMGEPSQALEHFMRCHLATRRWPLSARTLAIAEQIVRPPPLQPMLQGIYLESRVLELVGEALAALDGAPPPATAPTPLRPREHQRLRELKAFLACGAADSLTLDEIARHAGVNANTLQRQFRAAYGTTVYEHLRECRLQRARQALESDGVSVGEAARVAGYTSAANFATAYRRRFGHAPKLARSRI